MAEQLTPIAGLANNSPLTLIALANSIVNTMATTMVTANGSANGALTNGNGYVSGIFGASTLVTGSLRGGSIQTSANLVISSNVFVNSSGFSVGNSSSNVTVSNTTLTAPIGAFTNVTVSKFPQASLTWANSQMTGIDLTTTGTSALVMDSFPLASLRTAEYIIQVNDNNANNHQASKFFVTHDGVNALFTEYALLVSNTTIATFSATTNATSLIVQVTPGSTNTTVRALRTGMNA